MKIAVCVKLNRGELSPFDASALECALSVPQAEIVAVSMAPPQAKDPLAALTRLGNVRGLLISDGAFAGSDTIATSRVLAAAIARISPDLVLCGRQSTDGDTAQVPPMLAERLGYGFIPYVTRFGLTTADTRLGERQVKLPAVMSVERIAALRRPSIFSRAGETEIVSNAALGLPAELVGQKGSPTRVVQSFSNKNGVRKCEFITAAQLPEAIRAAQKGRKKRERVKRQGEKLREVCYVGNIGNTAEEIAQRAVPLSGSAEEIAQAVKERGAQVLLFEATLQNRALAPAVAVKLEAGLTADCTLLSVENGKLRIPDNAFGFVGAECNYTYTVTGYGSIKVQQQKYSTSYGTRTWVEGTEKTVNIKDVTTVSKYEPSVFDWAIDGNKLNVTVNCTLDSYYTDSVRVENTITYDDKFREYTDDTWYYEVKVTETNSGVSHTFKVRPVKVVTNVVLGDDVITF